MRVHILCAAGITLAVTAVVYHRWRTAGQDEMEAITARVASAAARGDREALTNKPVLQGHPDTAEWLLRHRQALANGSRVTVHRNGADGHDLMSPDVVSHLGVIRTSDGTLSLGFRYDRETGRLEFVTASYSTFPG